MVIEAFPPVELADEYGLLAIGGDLDVESLLLAYSNSIFPWPIQDFDEIPWFSPPLRAVIFFSELKIPKSLKKRRRNCGFRFTIDQDFPAVIDACRASNTRKRSGETWITAAMQTAYINLHRAGFAHSLECYNQHAELVGGIYGVGINGMFAGESMFYRESDASKLALWQLIEHLQQRGATWLDCQQLTPLVEQFGAREIPRQDFLELLDEAIDKETTLFP